MGFVVVVVFIATGVVAVGNELEKVVIVAGVGCRLRAADSALT